ncbi:MAG TPA: membrane protein insertion efficiency factor YidD, partial [Luteolibacter sp.]|nr:membrane protein insertion efficiency factor YidD [Luteolibacter sp.]
MKALATRLIGWIIRFYQRLVSPLLHALCPGCGCRYHPTCSCYFLEAVE